jgi:Tfp pilus assembly protein PilF
MVCGEEEPNHSIGWNYVGLCRAQLGDVDLALRAHERAVAIEPDFKEAWVSTHPHPTEKHHSVFFVHRFTT